MKTKSFCLFCGSDSETNDHEYCRERLSLWRQDMTRLGPVLAMQLAENGHYGRAPHRSQHDPKDWVPRAIQLRNSKKKWREIADILNREGFKSKHGHALDAALILNNLHNINSTNQNQPTSRKPKTQKGKGP